MNEQRQRLWLRRQELLRQSGELRVRLERHGRGLAPLWRVADGVCQTALWLRAHPLLPAAALAFLVWRRPRSVLRWGRRGWQAFKWWRRARAVVSQRIAALGALFAQSADSER